MILVLAIITADVQTWVGRVEVPVIREPKSKIIDCCAKSPNLGKRNKVKIQLAVSKLANEWVDIEKEGLRPPAKNSYRQPLGGLRPLTTPIRIIS